MSDEADRSRLMRSLGRLVRGLSALFWGLPMSLLASVGVARMGWFRDQGWVVLLLVNGLLVFGLWQMAAFQSQERVWRAALDRCALLALINAGLSPFLFWWGRVPVNEFFDTMVLLATCSGLIFLMSLNQVLQRLSAMLPDETLRSETRSFTALNRLLLLAMMILVAGYGGLLWWPDLSERLGLVLAWAAEFGYWIIIVLVLLPLSMTMALLWKTKEIILDNVFSRK